MNVYSMIVGKYWKDPEKAVILIKRALKIRTALMVTCRLDLTSEEAEAQFAETQRCCDHPLDKEIQCDVCGKIF